MSNESYKNILANKYMRDTNYIIIKDTDNIDDLELQWNKFCSYMTPRQQRLSDDKSIEIWNMTNLQHYEYQKEILLSKIKEKEIIDSELVPGINNDDIMDSLSSEEKKEFVDTFYSKLKDELNLNEAVVNTQEPIYDDLQDDPNDNDDNFNKFSNIKIVGNINGKTPEEKLKDLEFEFIRYNSQTNDVKLKADDQCRALYGGMSNLERYNKLKAELLMQVGQEENNDSIKFIDSVEPAGSKEEDQIEKAEKISKSHEETINETIRNDRFLSYCYAKYIYESINESKQHKKLKRLEDLPYFTPQELIDLGVHGRDNYYGVDADNDGLTQDISISTWFDSYKDISMNHIFEDYRKEWIDKLNELYSDYYDISDEAQLLARKQSILDLGWNPEIPFNSENRLKATDRVNSIFQETIPNDIFIDIDNIPEINSEVSYNELANSTNYEPVFLVLTKGKTPIVSQGIRFITKSDYSHVGISFDPELNKIYSFNIRENVQGFIVETLKTCKDNIISVFAFFAEKSIVDKLKETIYDFANHKTNFDLRLFAKKVFNINHKTNNNEYNQVCSTFVDTVLKSGSINLTGDLNIPTPGDIYNGIKSKPNKIFEVYYGIAPKYNGKKVKNQVNYLINDSDTLSINEACKDLKTAREFVNKVGQLAKKYDANYFIVTDGASGTKNNGNPAVKNARDAQIEWEKNNGFDPNEDWSKQTINESSDNTYYRITYNNNGIYEELKKVMYNINNNSSEWNKFKKSKNCSWLPLPNSYGVNNISYFTKNGYDKFMKLTYPIIIKYLDKDKINIEKINSVSNIQYKDKYQVVCSKQTISNESSDIYYNDEIISEGDEFMLEFIQDIKNGVNPYSKKKFYHISFDENLDDKILKPRIPSWITRMKNEDEEKFIKDMEKSKNATKDYIGSGYEEYKTPRVCFSNSIEGCLNSIICGKDRMSLAGKQIHVYTPEKPIGEYKHKSNKSIKRDGDVFDANITNEMWVLEPVKVKYVGSIVVDKVLTEKLKKFANNKHRKIIKYIYKWHWFHKVKYNINTESSDILSINEEALPNGYTLRNATKDDFDNMYKWGFYSLTPENKKDPKVIEYMKKDTLDSIRFTKIVMYKNEPIGMLSAEMHEGYWYIADIYIIKEHRGKGLGTILLKNEIEKHDKILLQVAKYNHGAIKLYKSLGFKITGENGDMNQMHVMKLHKKTLKEENINENVSDMVENKDICLNLNKFDSGESNIIFISGMSGSGKSTLGKQIAKEYNAEYVEIDYICLIKTNDKLFLKSRTNSILDKYIADVGGPDNMFSKLDYSNKWESLITDYDEYKRFFSWILEYANSHKNKKFIVEGVQIYYYNQPELFKNYPIIIKGTTGFGSYLRRMKRYANDIDISIPRRIRRYLKHTKNAVKNNFYKSDYDRVIKFSTTLMNSYNDIIEEQFSYLNEVKKFPVEFDDDGNLTIYKCRMGNISYGDEIDDSVQLLESYRNTSNIEGMKYELSRIWFIINDIEKRMTKRINSKHYDEYVKNRATAMNVFKTNIQYVMKADNTFNFAEYYNNTPFSDNSIKISNNTLKYSFKALKTFLFK